jgi:hypothetical protein
VKEANAGSAVFSRPGPADRIPSLLASPVMGALYATVAADSDAEPLQGKAELHSVITGTGISRQTITAC